MGAKRQARKELEKQEELAKLQRAKNLKVATKAAKQAKSDADMRRFKEEREARLAAMSPDQQEVTLRNERRNLLVGAAVVVLLVGGCVALGLQASNNDGQDRSSSSITSDREGSDSVTDASSSRDASAGTGGGSGDELTPADNLAIAWHGGGRDDADRAEAQRAIDMVKSNCAERTDATAADLIVGVAETAKDRRPGSTYEDVVAGLSEALSSPGGLPCQDLATGWLVVYLGD